MISFCRDVYAVDNYFDRCHPLILPKSTLKRGQNQMRRQAVTTEDEFIPLILCDYCGCAIEDELSVDI